MTGLGRHFRGDEGGHGAEERMRPQIDGVRTEALAPGGTLGPERRQQAPRAEEPGAHAVERAQGKSAAGAGPLEGRVAKPQGRAVAKVQKLVEDVVQRRLFASSMEIQSLDHPLLGGLGHGLVNHAAAVGGHSEHRHAGGSDGAAQRPVHELPSSVRHRSLADSPR